jgi:hypothetical protein
MTRTPIKSIGFSTYFSLKGRFVMNNASLTKIARYIRSRLTAEQRAELVSMLTAPDEPKRRVLRVRLANQPKPTVEQRADAVRWPGEPDKPKPVGQFVPPLRAAKERAAKIRWPGRAVK